MSEGATWALESPALCTLTDTFEAQCEYEGTRDVDGKVLRVMNWSASVN